MKINDEHVISDLMGQFAKNHTTVLPENKDLDWIMFSTRWPNGGLYYTHLYLEKRKNGLLLTDRGHMSKQFSKFYGRSAYKKAKKDFDLIFDVKPYNQFVLDDDTVSTEFRDITNLPSLVDKYRTFYSLMSGLCRLASLKPSVQATDPETGNSIDFYPRSNSMRKTGDMYSKQKSAVPNAVSKSNQSPSLGDLAKSRASSLSSNDHTASNLADFLKIEPETSDSASDQDTDEDLTDTIKKHQMNNSDDLDRKRAVHSMRESDTVTYTMLHAASRFVYGRKTIAIKDLAKHFNLKHFEAKDVMEALAKHGCVSKADGKRPRKVLNHLV